ncbi:bifunctional nicotinamidase/pyrazinamidase [Algoriphagus sp.]|uniref:bifunctional nicotinamidase/pyrazinamidase n=1 Tax=Algoriphagus sp. TaxID=1872435 RepID=UPI0025E00293|nr:bifunctional nicotinamidase/pyrazinamidase [Algoriphagus sp.]
MQSKESALIIVDVQNDFLPNGALAVHDGDQVIPIINKLQKEFQFIVATQDFHPADHGSFAANHSGKKISEFVTLGGLNQILWPVHCVQGTFGAEFHKDLNQDNWKAVFQKGKNKEVDSYSGFFDNARKESTGLADYLMKERIKKVYITGLALDYCVKFTALDAHSLGFETYLIVDSSRAVNIDPMDGDFAIEEMAKQGIKIINSQEIL